MCNSCKPFDNISPQRAAAPPCPVDFNSRSSSRLDETRRKLQLLSFRPSVWLSQYLPDCICFAPALPSLPEISLPCGLLDMTCPCSSCIATLPTWTGQKRSSSSSTSLLVSSYSGIGGSSSLPAPGSPQSQQHFLACPFRPEGVCLATNHETATAFTEVRRKHFLNHCWKGIGDSALYLMNAHLYMYVTLLGFVRVITNKLKTQFSFQHRVICPW